MMEACTLSLDVWLTTSSWTILDLETMEARTVETLLAWQLPMLQCRRLLKKVWLRIRWPGGCLADNVVMDNIGPGDHGSTYGGNPLGMAIAHAAVSTIVEEGLVENSLAMGELLKSELSKINSPLFKEIRGRGLFVGVELRSDLPVNGTDFAKILCGEGLLTKSTHDYTVRFAPPLVITEAEVKQSVEVVAAGTHKLEQLVKSLQ